MKFRILLISILITLFFSCTHKSEKREISNSINVGVFNGNGASPVCVIETMEALKIDSGINPREISAVDIMNGTLDNMDVIIFPGGSGSKEYNNMGALAAEKVIDFAGRSDKGIVGICAGGYLLASTPNYPSLKLLPVHSIREYYNRGRGLISFSTTIDGDKIFPELSNQNEAFVQYYDGPMYYNIDSTKFNILATINTDIATKKGYPKGVSVGKPAFGAANYKDGKIIMSVGHPEATSGMRWMVPRMARWVANKPLISYGDDVVRPEKYSGEKLFYTTDIARERKYFWELSSDNDDEVIAAIDSLALLNSRPSIRWSIGLLRHNSPKVRAKAAEYLLETEYTWAIPDIVSAYDTEQNKTTKVVLKHTLDQLKKMANH